MTETLHLDERWPHLLPMETEVDASLASVLQA